MVLFLAETWTESLDLEGSRDDGSGDMHEFPDGGEI